jgi:D-aminopeptidase
MHRRDFLAMGLSAACAWPLSGWPASISLDKRCRLRDLGLTIGDLPTGPLNALTDVSGVRVGHVTLIRGEGPLVVGKGPVRTGVTAILPHGGVLSKEGFYAGTFVLNGNGELTGLGPIRSRGLLSAPVLFTNTSSVGSVYDGAIQWMLERDPSIFEGMCGEPVVGETWGDFLNDTAGRHVRSLHGYKALTDAKTGPISEGCVGGGTAMRAFEFKAGIGTSSRVIDCNGVRYTLGALVQSNFGRRGQFRVDGVPVGREIPNLLPKSGEYEKNKSMLMVIATDAPLIPVQLQRLCKRVAMGLARTGAISTHGSGDLFLAFSTAQKLGPKSQNQIEILSDRWISHFHKAVVESTEESILNSLTMAETMKGRDDNVIHALPLDRLVRVMKDHGRL